MAKLVPTLVSVVLILAPGCATDPPPEPEVPPTGVVVDEAGRPVEGAIVSFVWPTAARALWPVPYHRDTSEKTDHRGRFRWERNLPSSAKRWFAVHRDLGIGMAAVAASEADLPVEIRLRPGLRVDVAVRDPDGGRPGELEVAILSKERDPWAPTEDLPRAYCPEISRVSGPDVSLPGLSGHPFVLWIRASGYRPHRLRSDEILPEPGARRRKVEVVLEEGFSIAGRIRYADGKPVVGATVHVNDGGKPRNATEPFWCLHEKTDEEGRFVVGGLTDGTFIIRAHVKGPWTSVLLAEGVRAGTTGLELTLPK